MVDVKDFVAVSEETVLMRKNVFKSLVEESATHIYENEKGKIVIGRAGVFYENKDFPNRDYTYSTKFKKKFLVDNSVRDIIGKLKDLRMKVKEDNSLFFYYGFMYRDGSTYELNYNFHRKEKEECGKPKEELPEIIKIKIYSNIKTIFSQGIKNGIIVILRLQEKSVLIEIPHEGGGITTQF